MFLGLIQSEFLVVQSMTENTQKRTLIIKNTTRTFANLNELAVSMPTSAESGKH